MVLIEVDDAVGFDGLNKQRFIGLCTMYSFVDSVVNHPFAVGTAVAELHKKQLAKLSSSSSVPRITETSSHRFGLSGNLSFRESMEYIQRVNFVGLLSGDLCQMVAYNYFKTRLDDGISAWRDRGGHYSYMATHIPVPAVSGFAAMSICAIPINAATVIFRHQVRQRVAGNNHHVHYVLRSVIPSMEGGLSRVLLRGTLASSMINIPSAAICWQVYESSKDRIRESSGSHALWTSLLAGGLAGGMDVLLTRPLGVILARSQTNHKHETFSVITKRIVQEEGYGALYKGLGCQMLSNIPRMAVFYGLYSTFVTWAKEVSK